MIKLYFLEKMKSEKYLIIFLYVFIILLYYIYTKIQSYKKKIENFTNLDTNLIEKAINKYYSSDDFDNVLLTITKKIEKGIEIPTNLEIIGNIKVDGNISDKSNSINNIENRFNSINPSVIDRLIKAKQKAADDAAREAREAREAAERRQAAERAQAAAAAAAYNLYTNQQSMQQSNNDAYWDALAERERQKALEASKGKCGQPDRRIVCGNTYKPVQCPIGRFNNECLAKQAGCTNCPRI